MPVNVTGPAARAFSPEGKDGIPLKIPPAIPRGLSASTARLSNASIIPIISARRIMWTSRAAAPATAARRPARPLRRAEPGRCGKAGLRPPLYINLSNCNLIKNEKRVLTKADTCDNFNKYVAGARRESRVSTLTLRQSGQ